MKPSERGPRNLIVLADSSPGYSDRLDTAIGMAVKFNAFLTGVFLQQLKKLPHDETIRRLPQNFFKEVKNGWDDMENEAAVDAENIFWNKVNKSNLNDKAQWKKISGSPDDVAATISRYADLILSGQKCSTHYQDFKMVDPGAVVVKSGRPIFVVPQKFTPKGYTAHALFAWDGSGEATRALSDALLILGPETEMTIVTVDSNNNINENFGFDLDSLLKSRGIKTKHVTIERNNKNCGQELVNYARKVEADLIVMGAYRHSRIRQSVFGGVTNSVLKNMQTPVFLSH